MTRWRILFILGMCLVLGALAQAQDIAPIPGAESDPQANISWPPPVYTLRDDVEIRGTVAVSNMANFFVEFRPLNFDPNAPADENRPWFPATLPSNAPVENGILGTWNTKTAPDGLYEIRLTVNINGEGPRFYPISPLRVENNPPSFLNLDPQVVVITPTLQVPTRPTLAPTPTAFNRNPQLTTLVDANVRLGDGTNYDVVGSIAAGTTLDILGVSSYGTGWFYIQLENGRRGFIAPSVVSATGDIRTLQRIDPPPPPTPVATATPIPSGNLHFTAFYLDPAQPTCAQTFTIYVTVQNNGTAATLSGGQISIRDTHFATGTTQQTTTGAFPILGVGQTFTAVMPLTVSTYFDETHEITVVIDSQNQVQETNEGDNVSTLRYTLQKGGCG